MPKWIAFFLALILFFIPALARSQEAVQFSTLEVDLWPEYDQPGVLVIYHITLPDETTLPVDLEISIPQAAGEPNAVAVQQPNGQLFSLDWQPKTNGDYTVISFSATLPQVQIEYYDPRLTINDKTRNFTYTWPGDYAAKQMRVEVQQPAQATNLSVTPGPVSRRSGGDNLTYYFKEIGPVTQGQSFTMEVSYQKESTQLTVESLQVEPSAPLSTDTTWQDWLRPALPWILGAIGIMLILGGGYWFFRSGRQAAPVKRFRRSRRSSMGVSQDQGESNIYCHQCGRRAAVGDVFCRSCGTRLRVEP